MEKYTNVDERLVAEVAKKLGISIEEARRRVSAGEVGRDVEQRKPRSSDSKDTTEA